MIQRAAACAAVLFAVHCVVAAQTERAPAQTQADQINQRIRALQSEAERLATQARTLLDELRALEVEEQLQVERVRQARDAVARGRTAIEDLRVRLDWLERERLAQLPDLRAQLVDIYKRGRSGYARLLFGGTTMRDFRRAARAIAAMIRINERRVAEHRNTLDGLRRERTRLDEELQGLMASEAQATQAQVAADRALAARTLLLAQIDARRDLTAQFAGELQVAYQRLQQQVATVSAGGAAEPIATPLTPFRGALDWPATGPLAARFGQPSGRPGDTTNRSGIEIAAPEGAPVRAVHPGTVSYANPFAAFGNLVIVEHGNNTSTLYGYLASISVAVGNTVDGGTELGRVGSAPAGAPSLYFEMRVDGRSVDPVQWLRPR